MNLREKLTTIRKELHNIKKSGRNEFHKYDYVTGADTAGIIGNRLAELNVLPGGRNLVVGHYTVESAKGSKSITTLQLEYGFLDADSDEQLWYPAYGEGEDATDKGAYKAWTGAQKYWLIQAFMLAMGEDPEFEKEKDERREPTPKPLSAEPKADALRPALQPQSAGSQPVGSPPATEPASAALLTEEQRDGIYKLFDKYEELAGTKELEEAWIGSYGGVAKWTTENYEKRLKKITATVKTLAKEKGIEL